MRRPLRTAIAVIVATAMLTPTIASAAPVVPDAPSPVPGVESSSPYADDGGAAPDGAGRDADDAAPSPDGIPSGTLDTRRNDGAGNDAAPGDSSADAGTAKEDAAAIEGAEVLSDGGDGTGKVLLADEAAVGQLDGRDYVGQTVKEINRTKYILIGNEQQLRAIGSGVQVHDVVYSYRPNNILGDSDFKTYYPGDADLDAEASLHEDSVKEWGGSGDAFEGGVEYRGKKFCGVKANGAPDSDADANTGLYYTADADYIIFRDIDLTTQVAGEPEDGSWTPLMFSGRMFGADGSGQEQGYLGSLLASLQDESTSVDVSMVTAPTISNVTVNQEGKMDSRAHSGIGFFGTVSSNVDTSDIGHSAGTAAVSNIGLDHVSVTNSSTETESTETLISGLTDLLGGLLGGVLSGLSGTLSDLLDFLGRLVDWIPGIGSLFAGILKGLNDVQVGALGGLGNVLKGILDLRKDDPTTFATGAFAGRIVGDVDVNHCTVTDAEVENASAPGGADSAYVGMTGGFVGYMEGQAKYDGLSQILGDATDGLHALLNIIPGVGLGDLLELLSGQGNVAGLDKLVPVGYYNPVIDGCALTLSDDSIGTSDTTYAGGFVGLQIGSIIRNSSVSDTRALSVSAGEVGGFIGQAAAGSTLGADGIDLLGLVMLSGLLTVAQTTHLDVSGSTVNGIGTGFTVKASGKKDAAETDQFTAGGFYGRASSMTTTDSHVTNLKSVTAPNTNGMAGGFVGLSTTGGLAQVASDEDESSGVLGDLTENGLLSVDNLVGVVPYMVPSYRCTDVTYVAISEGYNVKGDVAGGYAGLFESGEVNVFDEDHPLPDGSNLNDLFAVRNIASVYGEHYAGGFAGKAVSGSLAEAGGGLSLLGGAASIDLTKLINLVQAYVPVIRYADVLSEGGFTVEAAAIDGQERATSGAAGGQEFPARTAIVGDYQIRVVRGPDCIAMAARRRGLGVVGLGPVLQANRYACSRQPSGDTAFSGDRSDRQTA